MRPQEFQPLDYAVIPRFAEPATFMRTPYVHSYAGLDIALVGVPFDLGSTNRAGARHGPAQIREMSRLIRRVNASSAIAPFDLCQVADVGDAPQNPLDLLDSIHKIQAFFATLHAAGVVPVTAGGDHTITLPILRALATAGPVGCIHFAMPTPTPSIPCSVRGSIMAPHSGALSKRSSLTLGG